MRIARILLSFLLTVSLVATACGSTPPESLAATGTGSTTVAPVETTAAAESESTEQVSGDAQAVDSASSEATTVTTTTTGTTEADDSETNTTVPAETCEAPELVGHLVDVSTDDPDGGLNVRNGPGTSYSVILTAPRGVELISTGKCEVVRSTEWWEVHNTDGSQTGWVSSNFLSNEPILEPDNGSGDPEYSPGVGAAMADPSNIGIATKTLEEMLEMIANEYGFDQDRVITEVQVEGIDAIGGFGVWNITGAKDDSISGYRVEINFDFLKDDNAENIIGYESTNVSKAALCSRGVTDDGLCI